MSSPLRLRAVGYDDQLALVDHLSELRTRLLVCAAVLVVAFAGGLWQSRALLDVLNRPLADVPQRTLADGGPDARLDAALSRSASAFARLGRSPALSPADHAAVRQAATSLRAAAHATQGPRRPVTLGLGEPFSTSLTVALAFAVIVALPILLWQGYAFLIPAVPPALRRGLRPLLALAPGLFLAGVAFGYELVLPAAVRFLQGFNQGAFDTFVQARDYYHFELTTLLAVGAIFELPVALLALAHAGVMRAAWLRAHRRVAIVALAVLAAALPGTDPVTTLVELVPLLALYELSIVLVSAAERRAHRSGRLTSAPAER